jgi:hypothetical protein
VNNRDAARSGDLRKALEALRDTLAEMLDTTEAQIHAQLAAQYRATLADLAALPSAAPAETSKGVVNLDAAKKRRTDRQQSAAASE